VTEPRGTPTYIHASAVVLGESGVLIRGASGAGKSSLALALIDAWTVQGAFARLVSDDRVACEICGGRVLLKPHALIAGLAEWRGLGLLPQQYEAKAVLGLVVDLELGPPDVGMSRMPEQDELSFSFNGLKNMPRLRLPGRQTGRAADTIMAFLHNLSTK
jgi:serine kinase of HPr protein (carbohydrate metabolism regulator)